MCTDQLNANKNVKPQSLTNIKDVESVNGAVGQTERITVGRCPEYEVGEDGQLIATGKQEYYTLNGKKRAYSDDLSKVAEYLECAVKDLRILPCDRGRRLDQNFTRL
ncbi:MAG: hypothetical protein LBJ95_03895 [Oscillospiraceae bacterium]|nr:hypothetical protein [Oscillospiraceae bacterium]